MKISAFIACVNYADKLERSLAEWADGCDELVVVTSPEDAATVELCQRLGVQLFPTTAFYEDGAILNKALALSRAFDAFPPTDWALFVDADCVPPPGGWRGRVERGHPQPGTLYGAKRVDEAGKPYDDGEVAGFFHLFHVSDARAQERPLFGSWLHAGSYDSAFYFRWGRERSRVLNLTLTHLGEPGQNWCGRGREDLMREALERRRTNPRGWRDERLDGKR